MYCLLRPLPRQHAPRGNKAAKLYLNRCIVHCSYCHHKCSPQIKQQQPNFFRFHFIFVNMNWMREPASKLQTRDLWDIWLEWWEDMTWPKKTYIPTHLPTYLCTPIREHSKGAILGTCDIWDTDYNSNNWEPEFMTIFVTWQSRVTVDSIRNSCDVY